MKDVRNVLDLKKRNTLRVGILLLSTLSIVLGTAIVYSRVVYEQALNVNSTGGGSGSTVYLNNFAPVLTVLLVFSGIIGSPSLCILLLQASKRNPKSQEQTESVLPTPILLSPESESQLESIENLENEDDAMKIIRDILHPKREQSTVSQ